jgi:hypothetical protein
MLPIYLNSVGDDGRNFLTHFYRIVHCFTRRRIGRIGAVALQGLKEVQEFSQFMRDSTPFQPISIACVIVRRDPSQV